LIKSTRDQTPFGSTNDFTTWNRREGSVHKAHVTLAIWKLCVCLVPKYLGTEQIIKSILWHELCAMMVLLGTVIPQRTPFVNFHVLIFYVCRLLVGAPVGKNLQPETNRSGALFKCPITTWTSDCEQIFTDGARGKKAQTVFKNYH
jgi:hypothetical protein